MMLLVYTLTLSYFLSIILEWVASWYKHKSSLLYPGAVPCTFFLLPLWIALMEHAGCLIYMLLSSLQLYALMSIQQRHLLTKQFLYLPLFFPFLFPFFFLNVSQSVDRYTNEHVLTRSSDWCSKPSGTLSSCSSAARKQRDTDPPAFPEWVPSLKNAEQPLKGLYVPTYTNEQMCLIFMCIVCNSFVKRKLKGLRSASE